MKMIELKEQGYIFISKSGVEYELLEGLSMGTNNRFTSDIIFIMLSDERYSTELNPFVNFLHGATFIEDSIEEYNEIISGYVEEYEKQNNINQLPQQN